MVDTRSIYIIIRVNKEKIGTVAGFLEGLEIGLSRTIDEEKGLMELCSPVHLKNPLKEFVEDLKTYIEVEIVETKVAD